MIHFGLKPGMKLAVAGLGGLGAMAVLIGKAMGAEVTVLSRPGPRRGRWVGAPKNQNAPKGLREGQQKNRNPTQKV